MAKKVFVSLGMSCQTTHQLRRMGHCESPAGQPQAGPPPSSLVQKDQTQADAESVGLQVHSGLLDWLICPPESIINLLNDGIPDFTRNSIRIHKDRPYWEDYDLYFWHYFNVTNNQNRQINIDDTFAEELSRWSYLRDRFSKLVPAETIFVVSNTQNNLATEVYEESEQDHYHFRSSVIDELEVSLAKYFDTALDSIHLEVLTRENRSTDLHERRKTTFLPIDQNEWKGSKQSWDLWWQKLCSTLVQ